MKRIIDFQKQKLEADKLAKENDNTNKILDALYKNKNKARVNAELLQGEWKKNILFRANKIKKKNIDLSKSYVIGDRWRDIDFAHNLKCKSIFINRKYDEKLNKKPNYVCKSTAEAIITVLKNE